MPWITPMKALVRQLAVQQLTNDNAATDDCIHGLAATICSSAIDSL
jgi:hypothetical protein